MRTYCILALAICCFSSRAADDEFYRHDSTLVDTNQRPLRPVTSPLLVDSKNTGAKVTNAVLNLEGLQQAAELSGVRLGMTMGEVVGCWGKPKGASSPGCLHGLPTFFY